MLHSLARVVSKDLPARENMPESGLDELSVHVAREMPAHASPRRGSNDEGQGDNRASQTEGITFACQILLDAWAARLTFHVIASHASLVPENDRTDIVAFGAQMGFQ